MFDLFPSRLFPPALLAGLTLYGLVTMFWLQPVVERRMAEFHLVPACEAALETEQETTPLPEDPRRLELQMTIEMLESMGADQIPILREQLQAARRMLRQMSPTRLRVSGIERTGICSCSVDTAFERMGLKMTLHVATARTYQPTQVRALPQSTLAIARSGQCGALPWTKG